MKLYAFLPGPFPRRVIIYLALKKVGGVEIIPCNIFEGEAQTPEFLEKNPGGGVPLLQVGDAAYVSESQAILNFLEDWYAIPPMRGLTEAERRCVDVQSAFINDFYYHCKASSMNLSPYASKIVAQSHDVDMVTGPFWRMRLEQVTVAMGSNCFLAAERPTIADCMLFPLLEYIREVYDIFIPPHLKPLKAWYERFRNLPGIPLLDLPDTYHDEMIAIGGSRV